LTPEPNSVTLKMQAAQSTKKLEKIYYPTPNNNLQEYHWKENYCEQNSSSLLHILLLWYLS